jgi:hypothetical protein
LVKTTAALYKGFGLSHPPNFNTISLSTNDALGVPAPVRNTDKEADIHCPETVFGRYGKTPLGKGVLRGTLVSCDS